MTAISDSITDPPPVSSRPRRNREELEELAACFVNSRLQKKVPLPPPPQVPASGRMPRAALGAGAALLAALALAWLAWPSPESTGSSRDEAAAAQAATAWAQRLEAERERQRRELQSGRDYLQKIASADSALLADMTARAQALETRAASAPASRDDEPTPLEPGPASPAQAADARAAPDVTSEAPVPAPAPAPQAVQAAALAAPRCGIHVSELSSSGKLTYADVARMKGARTDGRGHVFTPPVPADGRSVVFEVMPSGCVRIARTR